LVLSTTARNATALTRYTARSELRPRSTNHTAAGTMPMSSNTFVGVNGVSASA
jgi:hypothetical protein